MVRFAFLTIITFAAFILPAKAQLEEDREGFPLGPVGGIAQQVTGSSLLRVTEVTAGGPGEAAGLQPGDFIYGANGEKLPPMGAVHTDGWRGAVSELGYAIERSEAAGGALTLQVLRAGAGNVSLSVNLPPQTAWRPSFPSGDTRMSAYFDKVCDDLHAKVTASASGDFGYETGYFGMILLGHANWNSNTGARNFRVSINKLRDHCVAHLNSLILAPAESTLDCTPLGIGLENWKIMTSSMFLGEYRRKTGDTSANAAVQRAALMVANRIQSYPQLDNAGVSHQKLGRMGHCGMVGDYPHAGLSGLNIMNAHAKVALGILKGAGADFTALSGTSGLTIDQKFQLSWTWLKSSTNTSGGNADGNIGYGGVQTDDFDSAARTSGSAAGYEIYRAAGGTAATTDDLDKLSRMKAYLPRNWPRHQHAHAYTTGGSAFSQMLLPFLTVREQQYFHENTRFLHTLTRNNTGEVLYFPGRALSGGDDKDKDRYIRAGLAWAIGNGTLPSFPAPPASRIYVRMNSPRNDWPQLAARRVRTDLNAVDLDLDVTNAQGTVITSGFTAAWTQVSGAAVNFTSTNTPDTRVVFPSCGDYRLRLTVTAGTYTVVEDYDIEVMTAVQPDLSATVVHQPVSRSGVPGGCADFTTAVSGGGPFLYEWKRNGVTVAAQSTPRLLLTNLSTGSAGTYQCTIHHPGGQVVTAQAALTINAAVSVVPGGLKREVWYNTEGVSVANLTGMATYPLCPDATGMVPEAESPQNLGVLYGQKLSGWLVPPVTGSYTFYMASDDEGELWLSTNATVASKVKILTMTPWTTFRKYSQAGASAAVTLTAGQRYYIEALMINGGGGDHLSIAWKKPGDAVPADGSSPIPGAYLEYEKVTVDPEFDGLVSRWSFDEGSGTIARDAMGTANDGTLTGPSWGTGRRGGGLVFDSNDKIVCSNAGSLGGLTPFTVAAWVKVNAGNNTEGIILQQRAANGFNGEYIFLVRTTGQAGIFCYGGGAEQFNISSAKTINDGLWHHVAAMRDAAGGARIYVDGQLDGSVTGTTVRNLDANISIGIGADIRDNNRSFRGVIDDVRIYNRDLTATQVFALASTGEWSTAPWTGDTTAGIGLDTKWAYHFGAAGSTVVGESIVAGVAGANPSAAGDFSITGVANVYNGDSNSLTSQTGTGSATVAKDFIYGGNPATITLQGLIPGRRYVATILSMGWEAAGGRQVTFTSGSDTTVVDQDQYGDNNGLRVTYAFTADAATRVITVAPIAATPTYTFHFYALALWQQPFTVTNTRDAGGGSLRQALADAAASPGKDNITFDPAELNGKTITLTSELTVSDTAGVTVDASSLVSGVAVSGGNASRIFSNGSGSSLTLRRLTLTGGNGAGTAANGYGGAVLNSSGTLTIDRCTLAGNRASLGGAVYSSTSSVNGQILSTAMLTHCTIFDNSADLAGGAVHNNNGQTTLLHCTVSCNSAPFGAGVSSFGDNLTRTAARYCIIAGNGVSDVDFYSAASNSFLSQGYNLIGRGNATGSFVVTGDSINHTSGSIKLSPPGAFGGPAWTMALLPGSPAREAAPGSPDKFDQRGFPVVGLPDIGAYEAGTFTNYNAWIYETLPATASVAQHGASMDFDSDGNTNEHEWIAQTNPANAGSAFVLSLFQDGSDLKIIFPTVTGRTYRLQQSTSLESNSWVDSGLPAKTGNNALQNFIVTPATGPARRFYRVAVSQP